jgi:hypothetical protein
VPNVYERVDENGQVVERVQPTPGDYEDTRLGVAVLDGINGWRLAAEPQPAPTPDPEPAAAPVDPAPVAAVDPVAPQDTPPATDGTQPQE